jgi:hypothetical protein
MAVTLAKGSLAERESVALDFSREIVRIHHETRRSHIFGM